jgi:hypothetical protein
MARRSVLKGAMSAGILTFSQVAWAEHKRPKTVDEAIRMLDANELAELVDQVVMVPYVLRPDPQIGDAMFWLRKNRESARAAALAGYAVASIEGRRIGLTELKELFGFRSIYKMSQDERICEYDRSRCRDWLERLPGYVKGLEPKRQPQTTKDQVGMFEMQVILGLRLLEHGDDTTAEQIVAGRTNWRELDKRRKAERKVAQAKRA